MTDRRLAPKEVAELYGVSIDVVLCWIKNGELRAVNAGRRASGGKPRWKVSPADLERFELARSNTPATRPQRRRRRSDSPRKVYV